MFEFDVCIVLFCFTFILFDHIAFLLMCVKRTCNFNMSLICPK